KFRDVISAVGGYIGSGFAAAFRAASPFVVAIGDSIAELWPHIKRTGEVVWNFLVAAFKGALPILKGVATIVGAVLMAAIKAIGPMLARSMGLFRSLLATVRPLAPLFGALAAGILVYKGVMMGALLAQKLWTAA